MNIEVDKSHKHIDLREIHREKAFRMGVMLATGELVLTLLSGCGLFQKDTHTNSDSSSKEEIEMVVEDEVFDIEEHDAKEEVSLPYSTVLERDDGEVGYKESYTYEELEHITSLSVVLRDGEDYDFLNYMPNLKNLSIIDLSSDGRLDNIDGSRLPDGISIEINTPSEIGSFTEERFGFLKRISSIDSLSIGTSSVGVTVDSDYLQSLRNVHHLTLGLDITSNFQYRDLSYLDSLTLDCLPYDVVLYFSNDDLDALRKSGVEVQVDDEQLVRAANEEIDEIVAGFSLSENATDQEKLNAVLTYVLEHYSYDEEVSKQLGAGLEKEIDHDPFYGKGELTGALENPTQICGNYAAMVSVLCQRVGLDSASMVSYDHAWNAVKIGDYYYYVDSTWLDNQGITISSSETEETSFGQTITFHYDSVSAEELFHNQDQEAISELNWYMEDPTMADEIDDSLSHHAINHPVGVDFVEIPEDISYETTEESEVNNISEEEVTDISQGTFKIELGNRTFVVGAAVGVGILSALGIGVLVNRKKNERIRRERMRSSYHSTSPSSSWSTGSSYSSNSGYTTSSSPWNVPSSPSSNSTSSWSSSSWGDDSFSSHR